MDILPMEGMVVRHVIHGQGRFRYRLLPAVDGLVRTMDVRVDEDQLPCPEHGITNSGSEHGLGHGESHQGQTKHAQGQIGDDQGQIGNTQGHIKYGHVQRQKEQGEDGGLGFCDENHNVGEADQNKGHTSLDHGDVGHVKHGDKDLKENSPHTNTMDLCQNIQHGGEKEVGKQKENSVISNDENITTLNVSSKVLHEPQTTLPQTKDMFPIDCPISQSVSGVEEEGINDLPPSLQVTRLLAAQHIPQGSVIWEFSPIITENIWTDDDVADDITADVTVKGANKHEIMKTVVIASRPSIPTELQNKTNIHLKTSDTGEISKMDALPDVVHFIEMDGPEKCFIKDTCLNLNDVTTGDSDTVSNKTSQSDVKSHVATKRQNGGIANAPLNIVDNITHNSQAETVKDNQEPCTGIQNEANVQEIQDSGDVASQYSNACWEPCSAVERVGLEAMYENPEGPAALLLLYILVSAYHSPSMPSHYVILNNHLRFAKYTMDANISIRKSKAKVKVNQGEKPTVLIDQVIATRDITRGDEITRDFKMINEMEDMGNLA